MPWLTTPIASVALDAPVAGQHRARQRHRHPLARRDVGGAADDGQRPSPSAASHASSATAVGVGVRLDLQQLAHDDTLPVGAAALDALDLHAEQRQPLRERLRLRASTSTYSRNHDSGTSIRTAPGSAGRPRGRPAGR